MTATAEPIVTITDLEVGYRRRRLVSPAVRGVDLREPLSGEDRDAIVAACDTYGVLVFPDQLLSKEELVAFGNSFGEVDTTLQKKLMHRIQNRLGMDTVTDISNVDAEGNVAGAEHWQTITTVGNRFWHSDGSYKDLPIRYSILNAVTAVGYGGGLLNQDGALTLLRVRVSDNGCGIAPDQIGLAIASHATSKLETADDLFDVHTLGFRGEALASIARYKTGGEG